MAKSIDYRKEYKRYKMRADLLEDALTKIESQRQSVDGEYKTPAVFAHIVLEALRKLERDRT